MRKIKIWNGTSFGEVVGEARRWKEFEFETLEKEEGSLYMYGLETKLYESKSKE